MRNKSSDLSSFREHDRSFFHLLFLLYILRLPGNDPRCPDCVAADPGGDNSELSSGCVYDLTIADVHAHMINIAVLRIENQIARLCR